MLIADRHGDAFVYEYTPDGAEKIIINGSPGVPLTVTNFQLNRLSDKRIREVVAARSAENGFDRYQVLQNRIDHLQLPVTEDAMRNINAAVYVHKESEDAIERTLFHNMYDTSSCTAKIRLLPRPEGTMDLHVQIPLWGLIIGGTRVLPSISKLSLGVSPCWP